jgi:hypothetical protein
MSKIALTPNATGTGVFTISSPATNTNRTLTLPDEAGTVLTSASSLASANLGHWDEFAYVGIGTALPTQLLCISMGSGRNACWNSRNFFMGWQQWIVLENGLLLTAQVRRVQFSHNWR